MRKSKLDGTETCPETLPVKNSQNNNGNSEVQTNNNRKQADSTLLDATKDEHDEDCPINLVKGNRCNSPSLEYARGSTSCHEGTSECSGIGNQFSSVPASTTVSNTSSTINLSQNLMNSGCLRQGVQLDEQKLIMSDTAKSYPEENKIMKCANMIEQYPPKLESIDNAHPVLLSNPVMSVGGMLAKQLVSPLRSNYSNSSGCDLSNNREDSYSIRTAAHPSSSKLTSLTLTPSSSILQSPPSGAAHSNLVSYSRSHTKLKDSSPNHSFSPPSSVDLGSTTTSVVISNAIRNASITLGEDDQSSLASNLVVISDPQARNIETAGTKYILSLQNLQWHPF